MQDIVNKQIQKCYEKYGEYASAHEAFAVLQEEVEELWDEIKKKPKLRDYNKIHSEIIDCLKIELKNI